MHINQWQIKVLDGTA